jgi:hypothetical protein
MPGLSRVGLTSCLECAEQAPGLLKDTEELAIVVV